MQQIAEIPSGRGSEGLGEWDGSFSAGPMVKRSGFVRQVAEQFSVYHIPKGCIQSDACRPRWGKLSSFTDYALTMRLFWLCQTRLQDLSPNLAEASDFSLRTQMRDRLISCLWTALGHRLLWVPSFKCSPLLFRIQGRASKRLFRRAHGTEHCHPEDKGPETGCSCHRKGEGRAALRRKTRLVTAASAAEIGRVKTEVLLQDGALPLPLTATAPLAICAPLLAVSLFSQGWCILLCDSLLCCARTPVHSTHPVWGVYSRVHFLGELWVCNHSTSVCGGKTLSGPCRRPG